MSFCSVTDQCSLVFFGADRRHFLSIFHLFQCLIPSSVRGAFLLLFTDDLPQIRGAAATRAAR